MYSELNFINMSSASHHFLPGLNPQQGMHSQFVTSSIQSQMSTPMQTQLSNQLTNQIPVQLPSQIAAQLSSTMMSQINQMNPAMTGGSQLMPQLSQSYNIANSNQMPHQSGPGLQMQADSVTTIQHHTIPQQQQPVMQTNANVVPTPPVQQQQQPQSKEFNTASLCRIGQETVQDIVSRTQEVFQTLKTIQPPNGTPQGMTASSEKKAKIQEQLRTIRLLFKRLRLIYEKCNENCQLQGMEYTHIESLIPFKDEIEPKYDEKKNSEAYRSICEESKDIMEQVVLKNKQLKEVIDHLRRIIWEINTMLTMRRS